MAKLTREQRAEQAAAEQRTKKANEFRQLVDRQRALRVWDEKLAWQGDNHGDKAVQALWTMVREYEQCTTDLRKKLDRMVEECTRALVKLETNEGDALTYSNPMATPGSDIEQLATRRKAVADAIAHMGYVTGWYVPQIHSTRYRAWRDRLVSLEVVDSGGGYGVRLLDGEAAQWLASDGTWSSNGHVYETAELAWLAAATAVGDRSW